MSITLIEKLPIEKVQYLASLSFSAYKTIVNKSSKTSDQELRIKFDVLKSFTSTHIKSRGCVNRLYKVPDKSEPELGGRLYSGGSLQSLQKVFRGFLCRDIATDLDVVNCHPRVISYLAHKHEIECPNLNYYLLHRDECIAKHAEPASAKTEYLACLYDSESRNRKMKTTFEKDFLKEMRRLQKQITSLPEYSDICAQIQKDSYNYLGKRLSHVVNTIENQILTYIREECSNNGIELLSLAFDGCLLYGSHYENDELLSKVECYVNDKIPGLNVKLSYKAHDNLIQLPADFCPKETEINPDELYSNMKLNFETTHAFIVSSALYIRFNSFTKTWDFVKKPELIVMYENLYYKQMKNGEIVSEKFIHTWVADTHKRTYEMVDFIPPDLHCPANIFNTWTPFAAELMKDSGDEETNKRGVEIIINHFKHLFNEHWEYALKWVAHLVQYPSKKSTCITLISQEGTGKSLLFTLCQRILGDSKIYECADPAEHVWGKYNSNMKYKMLVGLDEIDRSDTSAAYGKIKNLISQPTITVHEKGCKAYTISSQHRFFITTNNDFPIKTSEDDRRKVIFKCVSQAHKVEGYFDRLASAIYDDSVVHTFYKFLKSMENVPPDMIAVAKPRTEYHQELIELSKSPEEMWFEYFCATSKYEKKFYTTNQLYSDFFNYCKENFPKYDTNLVKFGLRLSKITSPGLIQHRTKTSRGWNVDPTLVLDIQDRIPNVSNQDEVYEDVDR